MITISNHTQDRGKQVEWADHLKFLTPYRKSDTEDEDSSENDCSCVAFDASFFARAELQLRLTTPEDTPECTHYVAVSYCWSSSENSAYKGTPFSVTRQDGSTKRPSCPKSLLDRVIQFACGKGMSFIWIDQECIDQDDTLDKTVGIQAMDLVYQRAEYSLAVLEVCITEQRHLDGLERLLEFRPDGEDGDSLSNACEAMRIIMSDRWFERAWCLQESVSGCRRMTLLIKYDAKLEMSDLFRSEVEGCFEIELPTIHGILLSALQSRVAASNPFQLDPGIRRQCLQVIEEWSDKMPPDDATNVEDLDFDYHTACNAAAALHYLSRRHNSVVSDRLAIMANLCNFETRLDALELDELGFDFGICATVLAVINGDMSIMIGCEDARATGKGGRKDFLLSTMYTDELKNTRPFSWMLPGQTRLDQVSYLDIDADADLLRLDVKSISLENGLQVEGCLWIADHTIDLSAFALGFKKSWTSEVIDQMLNLEDEEAWHSDSKFEPPRVDLLIKFLCELFDRGYTDLVHLLWDTFRLKPGPSRKHQPEIKQYMKAFFEQIIDTRSQTIRWPTPMPHSNRRLKREHPFQDLGQRPLMTLTKEVVKGRLVVARPMRSAGGLTDYAALFGMEEEDVIVFTPKSSCGLSTPSRYGWYPSNWIVREVNRACDGTKSLAVEGSVCGLWSCDEGECEVFRLR